MFRPTRGQGLACLLLAVLPAGCQSTSREDCYPRDPLLLSKKPVEDRILTYRWELILRGSA